MFEYIRLLDFPSSPLVYTAIILTEIYWDLQMSNFSLTDEILTKFYTNGLVVTERSAQLRICLSVSHALGIVELNFNPSGTLIRGGILFWLRGSLRDRPDISLEFAFIKNEDNVRKCI